jgi:four helix bundle suffix protein
MQLVERLNDEEIANLCMTLIHQAIYMLDHLLDAQQEQFVNEGGVSEAMTRARLEARQGSKEGRTESDRGGRFF